MPLQVVREAVEYYVRGAAEIDAARLQREAAEQQADADRVAAAGQAKAKAAAAKPSCLVSFDEWEMLRLVAAAGA